jgi:hypothetical protein
VPCAAGEAAADETAEDVDLPVLGLLVDAIAAPGPALLVVFTAGFASGFVLVTVPVLAAPVFALEAGDLSWLTEPVLMGVDTPFAGSLVVAVVVGGTFAVGLGAEEG